MNGIYSENKVTLDKFLKPSLVAGWGISQKYFSNATWNILTRALTKAGLISKYDVMDYIEIKDLSQITLGDIKDLRYAGNLKISRLISELEQVQETVSKDDLNSDRRDRDKSIKKIALEVSLILLMLKSESWREEFHQIYNYSFDELEFDDPTIERNLNIFNARLDGLSLDTIGKEFGVTRERIRQIVEKLLVKAEAYQETLNLDLRIIFKSRLDASKNAPFVLEQQKKTNIILRAHQIIENEPGITLEELSHQLGIDKNTLLLTLPKNTKKFIFSENRLGGNISNFSDDDILEALKLTEAFESPINHNLYDNLVSRGLVKGPGSQTVMKRFGTWNKACQLANVAYNESVRDTYEPLWNKDEMLDHLIEFLKNRNYGSGIDNYDLWRIETLTNAPSGANVRNNFHTWLNAKNEALKKMQNEKISPNLFRK